MNDIPTEVHERTYRLSFGDSHTAAFNLQCRDTIARQPGAASLPAASVPIV
jgi:hypothetical protein